MVFVEASGARVEGIDRDQATAGVGGCGHDPFECIKQQLRAQALPV